jgi:hypothetical protein
VKVENAVWNKSSKSWRIETSTGEVISVTHLVSFSHSFLFVWFSLTSGLFFRLIFCPFLFTTNNMWHFGVPVGETGRVWALQKYQLTFFLIFELLKTEKHLLIKNLSL